MTSLYYLSQTWIATLICLVEPFGFIILVRFAANIGPTIVMFATMILLAKNITVFFYIKPVVEQTRLKIIFSIVAVQN